MGKRSAAAILVILALGALALFLSDPGGRRAGAPAARVPGAGSASRPDRAPAELVPAAAIASAPPVVPASGAPGAERTAAPSAGAHSWRVRVERAGVPVAGAELAWATRDEQRAVADEDDRIERVLRASAAARRALATGPDGEAHVPPLEVGTRIVARADGALASVLVRDDTQPPIVLALEPDRDLEVRVTDGRGAPVEAVGVVVTLMTGRVEHVTSRATDAGGIARFQHLGVGWGLDEHDGVRARRRALPSARPRPPSPRARGRTGRSSSCCRRTARYGSTWWTRAASRSRGTRATWSSSRGTRRCPARSCTASSNACPGPSRAAARASSASGSGSRSRGRSTITRGTRGPASSSTVRASTGRRSSRASSSWRTAPRS